MTSAGVAFVLSAFATAVITPFVRGLATRSGVVDTPGGRRVHQRITPRLGGVAVVCGFFTPFALFAAIDTGAMRYLLGQPGLVWGLLGGSVVVCGVGAVDDIRSLGPWWKLGAQAVAAVLAYAFGYRIEAVNIPLIGVLEMGLFALPVTVIWFLAITNALNLIDGLDGLAAGIALTAAASNLVIAYFNGSDVVVLFSAALAGSLIGFLRYNFNPATIFLGDSGSMFLGFVLAATSLAGSMTKSSTAITILAPVIALGLPIMDTLLAMIRRTLARQSIFTADRSHIHHRLLDLGLTTRRVVLTLYALSVGLALSAVAIAFGRSWHVGVALSAVGALSAFLVRAVARDARERGKQPSDALLAMLNQKVSLAVPALSVATTPEDIKRALEHLEGEDALVSRVSLRAFEPSSPLAPFSGAANATFMYEVSVAGRAHLLEIEMRKAPGASREAAAALLQKLAQACNEALNRPAASSTLTIDEYRLHLLSPYASASDE